MIFKDHHLRSNQCRLTCDSLSSNSLLSQNVDVIWNTNVPEKYCIEVHIFRFSNLDLWIVSHSVSKIWYTELSGKISCPINMKIIFNDLSFDYINIYSFIHFIVYVNTNHLDCRIDSRKFKVQYWRADIISPTNHHRISCKDFFRYDREGKSKKKKNYFIYNSDHLDCQINFSSIQIPSSHVGLINIDPHKRRGFLKIWLMITQICISYSV